MEKEENKLNSLIDAIGDKLAPLVNENKKQRAALFVVGEVDDDNRCEAGGGCYGLSYNISLLLRNAMSRKKNLAKDVMVAAMIEAMNRGFDSLDDYAKSLFKKQEDNERR